MSSTCQYDCLSQVPRKFYVSRSRSVASTARGGKFKGGARDPRAFLDELRPLVVFDEIQNAPENHITMIAREVIRLPATPISRTVLSYCDEA